MDQINGEYDLITKDMYRFLKRFPLWPKNKTQKQIDRIIVISKLRKLHLQMDGIKKGYVSVNGNGDNAGFYLTEKGKEVIEEYQRANKADLLSNITVIVSILTLLASLLTLAIR